MSEESLEPRCSHCGGRIFLKGIHIGLTAEIGDVGLSYKDGLLLVGTEPLRANLCTTCGTIQRLYVQDVRHNWQPKQPGGDLRDRNSH